MTMAKSAGNSLGCDPINTQKGVIVGEIARYNEAIDGLANLKDRVYSCLVGLRGNIPIAEDTGEVSDAGSGTIGELRRTTQRFEYILGELEPMVKELETY